MEDNEVIFIKGAERFSKYAGYGRSFKWDGDFKDESPRLGSDKSNLCREEDGTIKTEIVGFDAVMDPMNQFTKRLFYRDLNKAYVAFWDPHADSPGPIATGNWGWYF